MTVSWNFLVFDDFNRLTVRYFIECHSIGICPNVFLRDLTGVWILGRGRPLLSYQEHINMTSPSLERRVFICSYLESSIWRFIFSPHLSITIQFLLYVLMEYSFYTLGSNTIIHYFLVQVSTALALGAVSIGLCIPLCSVPTPNPIIVEFRAL